MRLPPSSQFVPNRTPTLSHMVGPNFHSHVYKLERWAIGEHICFYFVTQGPKRCFYWGVPNVTKKWVMLGGKEGFFPAVLSRQLSPTVSRAID